MGLEKTYHCGIIKLLRNRKFEQICGKFLIRVYTYARQKKMVCDAILSISSVARPPELHRGGFAPIDPLAVTDEVKQMRFIIV